MENGHITYMVLLQRMQANERSYQRANKVFFLNFDLRRVFILLFRLLFNKKKMPCFIGSQSYIFFMCDLSDLATRGRDGWNVCMCSGLPVDSSRRKLTFAAETPELEQSRKVLKIFFSPPLDSFKRFRLF